LSRGHKSKARELASLLRLFRRMDEARDRGALWAPVTTVPAGSYDLRALKIGTCGSGKSSFAQYLSDRDRLS